MFFYILAISEVILQNIVVACTDLCGKELHRQVGVGIVVTPGKPMGCNASTLAWNAREVGSSPALGTVFPIFIPPTTMGAVTINPVQAMQCMVVEPTLSMCICGHCLYGCNCKLYKTYNSRRMSVVVCTDL